MKLVLVLIALSHILLATQDKNSNSAPAPVGNQAVYVVANRTTDGKTDLAAEKKIRQEIGKQKALSLATTVAGADLVFFTLTEYDSYSVLTGSAAAGSVYGGQQTYLKSAFAIVVPVKVWTEHKGDLDALKEGAIWQGDAPNGVFESSLPKMVRKFCEQRNQKK